MLKKIQVCIEMEAELHKQLIAIAKGIHKPAEQIVRELIRTYIAQIEQPNAETIAAVEAVKRGEVNTYICADDFYHKLGI